MLVRCPAAAKGILCVGCRLVEASLRIGLRDALLLLLGVVSFLELAQDDVTQVGRVSAARGQLAARRRCGAVCSFDVRKFRLRKLQRS